MSIGSETGTAASMASGRVLDLTIDGAGQRPPHQVQPRQRGVSVDDIRGDEDVCIRATKNPIVLDTAYSSPDSSGEGSKVPVYTNILYRNVRIQGPGIASARGTRSRAPPAASRSSIVPHGMSDLEDAITHRPRRHRSGGDGRRPGGLRGEVRREVQTE